MSEHQRERRSEPCAWCAGKGTVDPVTNFLLARLRDREHIDSGQWIGRSSDSMVVAAATGGDPLHHPYDGWDLGRCLVTRAVAPESLHGRMDAILAVWVADMERSKAEEGHPYYGVKEARQMVAQHAQTVRDRIAALGGREA